jgi:acyl-CoA thioesterase FadM
LDEPWQVASVFVGRQGELKWSGTSQRWIWVIVSIETDFERPLQKNDKVAKVRSAFELSDVEPTQCHVNIRGNKTTFGISMRMPDEVA